jgi:transposase
MEDTPAASLPDDPAALKAMIAMLMRQRQQDAADRGTLMHRVDALEVSERRLTSRTRELELTKLRLEMELLKYKKWMYGPRADRLSSLNDVAQMVLTFGEEIDARSLPSGDDAALLARENASGVATHEASVKDSYEAGDPLTRRVQRGRRDFSDDAFSHLPTTRHEQDLAQHEKLCPCFGKLRTKIGEESSWQIEYVPGHFERLEHVRFKYACTHCEQSASPLGPQIVRADKPIAGAIDKGLAGPGLLAFIVTSKFSDYTPLYRLEDMFERIGGVVLRSRVRR